MKTYDKVLLVGCGNMAGAMLTGWIRGGIPPETFTVMNPVPTDVPDGVVHHMEMPQNGDFDAILLGVKPQILDKVVPDIGGLHKDAVMLSILAGTQLDTLAEKFPQAKAVVRVMPNLAVALGKAPIALSSQGLDDAEMARVKAFMDPLGTPEWVEESEFDLVTALAGSGPGFVYRFIAGLAQAAHDLGLPADQAERLSVAMVEGAAALAADSEHGAAELARRVASPGGVTQAGLDVLDEGGRMVALMTDTLRAARDRSLEMAEEARAGA